MVALVLFNPRIGCFSSILQIRAKAGAAPVFAGCGLSLMTASRNRMVNSKLGVSQIFKGGALALTAISRMLTGLAFVAGLVVPSDPRHQLLRGGGAFFPGLLLGAVCIVATKSRRQGLFLLKPPLTAGRQIH